MVRARRDPENISFLAMERGNGQPIARAQRSDQGLAQMTISDKACSLMEWNDDHQSSFQEVREILLSANI